MGAFVEEELKNAASVVVEVEEPPEVVEEEVVEEQEEELMLFLNPTDTQVFSLLKAKIACLSPRTSCQEKPSMEKNGYLSRAVLKERRLSTGFGILSEVNLLLVFWADWIIFISRLERRFSIWVLRAERASVMLQILLARYVSPICLHENPF